MFAVIGYCPGERAKNWTKSYFPSENVADRVPTRLVEYPLYMLRHFLQQTKEVGSREHMRGFVTSTFGGKFISMHV